MKENLYKSPDRFTLSTPAGRELFIQEPVGWDEVKLMLQRDEQFYGVNFEFVEDDVKLTFPHTPKGGGVFIKEIYDIDGGDGQIGFEFGSFETGSYQTLYAGTVNLTTYNDNDLGITASIEKTTFEQLFRTRYETKVTANEFATMDGRPLTPAEKLTVTMRPKEIIKMAKSEQETQTECEFLGTDYTRAEMYYQPETINQTTTELTGFTSMPDAFTSVAHKPWDESRYQLKATEAGVATVRFWGNVFFHLVDGETVVAPARQMYEARVVPFINIKKASDGSLVQFGPPITYYYDLYFQLETNFIFDYTLNVSLDINDEVYIGIKTLTQSSAFLQDARYYGAMTNITISQATTAPDAPCTGYNLFDLLNMCMQSITNVPNSVVSSFFGPGGWAYKTFITNGYALRNFNVNDWPVQVSVKDLIESMQAIWNIGLNFRKIGGLDRIVIEPMGFYYEGGEIARFLDPYDYEEGFDEATTYNEVELGYEKTAEDELNSLDEFNTEHTYLLPVRSFKKKFSRKCVLIASGYLIEKQRREQFAQKPSTSLSEDDNTFIIPYQDPPTFERCYYTTLGAVIIPDPVRRLRAVAGQILKIVAPGDPNDGMSFTIVIANTGNTGVPESYQVTPTPSPMTGAAADIQVLNADPTKNKRNETTEPFEYVTGVFSPQTLYGARLSPGIMFYNWSPVFNAALWAKPDKSIIKNTFTKQNGNLVTKFVKTPPRWTRQTEIKENADIELIAYNGRTAYYQNKKIVFKHQLTWPQYRDLADCLTGVTGTDRDRGFIVTKNRKGRLVSCHVRNCNYDAPNQTATFECLKIAEL